MNAAQFVAKWRASARSERAASQEQFIDLCRLLGEPTPTEADPTGDFFAFEKGANKTTGASGWADVWKRDHFAWEYKGKGKNLDSAFAQLQQYAGALGNPPLLVVSDMQTFRIHTAWTNTVSKVHTLTLDDFLEPRSLEILKWVLSDPERLRPGLTRQALTEQAAERFAALARRLRERGHDPVRVAHFVNRLVFCMFAEDVNLLPSKMFQRMLEAAQGQSARFETMARTLFAAMKTGGLVGFETVEWFNGGLFDDDDAVPMDADDIKEALAASRLDWSEIDPSIFGTLFERGLDPDKRSQLGAHYTDRDKILLIVEPVVVRPLLAEWEREKEGIQALLVKAEQAKSPGARTKARQVAAAPYRAFLDRIRSFRVLDPACGSGNFLYLALLALKDLEHRVSVEAEAMGLDREFPQVGPECVRGVEINAYAAELARISVWIGEIQWMRRNGFGARRNPILRPLDTIENRDALLNEDGSEAVWPDADVIIGNPPFLGGKLLRARLGDASVDRMFAAYQGRVPAEADLVCYWFAKAWERVRAGTIARAGLVSTNSIRGGANRRVLESVVESGAIIDAWSDQPWVIDGASVRVSLVSFALPTDAPVRLDGEPVPRINADLTATTTDLTTARRLRQNAGVAFMGDTKGGAFDIDGDLARQWLRMPLNPNGRPNADVLRPWVNGMDITRRPADKWIIDFGWEIEESAAALYEAPFSHVLSVVKPERLKNRRDSYRLYWWRHVEPRQGMWRAVGESVRFIVTPRVSKHRVFSWIPSSVVPDSAVIAIVRDDATTFGILHSRFHEAWTLRLCTWLGVGNDPRYTPSTTFETFPFPAGLTPDIPAATYADNPHAKAIAQAAERLDTLRRNWLNPPDLVRVMPEVVAGFPDRLVPKDDAAAATLRTRTLTNLYNQRPTWLDNAHRDLDAAVAAAYGWPADIATDEALARLLALNLERAGATAPPPVPADEEEEPA